jgi:hypothetical protein
MKVSLRNVNSFFLLTALGASVAVAQSNNDPLALDSSQR